MRKAIIATVIAALITWGSLYFTLNHPAVGKTPRMSQKEVNYISDELKRRCAGDCVIEKTDYGFVCRGMRTGKIYKLKVEL